MHMLTVTLNFYVKFTFYQPATVKIRDSREKRSTENESRNCPAPSTCSPRGAMD